MIPVHYSKLNYPSIPPQTGTNGSKSRKYLLNGFGEPLFQIMIRPFFYIVSSKDSFLMFIFASGKFGQDAKTRDRKTWVFEARKHLTIEN